MYLIVLFGVATGMRTMTALAVMCWTAWLGLMPVSDSKAAWLAKGWLVAVMTLAALGEYVGDTLPNTPSRKAPALVTGRLAMASFVGGILSMLIGQPIAGGVALGCVGALVGIYGGYRFRMWGAKLFGRDLPMALLESALALAICVVAMLAYREDVIFHMRQSALGMLVSP